MKLKKGDHVLIISGKDRAKTGKILRVFPRISKIVVEGANIKKKHRRPRKAGEKGQMISFPAPLFSFRAKLICPKCGKPTKVGHSLRDDIMYRICRKCKLEI